MSKEKNGSYNQTNSNYGLSEASNLSKQKMKMTCIDNKINDLCASQDTKKDTESKYSKFHKNEETELTQNALSNEIKNIYCEEGAEYFLGSKEIALESIHLDDEIIDEHSRKKIHRPKTINKVDRSSSKKKKLSLFKNAINKSEKKKSTKNTNIRNKFLFNDNKKDLMMKNEQLQDISPVLNHVVVPSKKQTFDRFTTYCQFYYDHLKNEKSIDKDTYKKIKKSSVFDDNKISRRESSTKKHIKDLIADLEFI